MRYACIAVAAVLVSAPSYAGGDQGVPTSRMVKTQGIPTQEDAAAKEELVAQMLQAAEQRSGKPWSERARANLRNVLLSRSLKELSDASAAGEGNAIDILMGLRNPDRNVLGSVTNDWVFTPLPTCRVLDTRPGSGAQGAGTGPWAAGTVHSFDVGTICNIPFPDAKAAVLNFVAVSASGNGNLRVWPWDSSNPAAPGTAVLNFTGAFNTSNYVVHPICNTATSTAGSCSDDLFVEPFVNSAHVVIDTVGYFAAPVTLAPCAVCNSCGGLWPIYQGSIHAVNTGQLTNERGPDCADPIAASDDTFPYICCR